MNAIRMVNVTLVVLVFTAWALSGVAAQRIVVPEQAMGDAVVAALDGAGDRPVPAVYPTATAPAQQQSRQGVSQEEMERARLAEYVDLHRGHPARANTKRSQTGEL